MYKIGEFAKITNLSIRTLRYYNDIELLVPEEVDQYSSYRYYGEHNIEEAEMIDSLKQAGFTLEEIKDNWNNFSDDKFIEKKKELYKEIYCIEEKIKQVENLRANNKQLIKTKKSA